MTEIRKKIELGIFTVLLILFCVGAVAAAPVHVTSLTHNASGPFMAQPNSVFVSGNYAYVTSPGTNSLGIYDVSNPAVPVHQGNVVHGEGGAVLDNPNSVFVSSNYAYITSSDSNSLEIADVSNPSAPVHMGSIVNGAGGALLDFPCSIFVSGNYAFVTSMYSTGNALEIIDVSNKAAPVHAGSIVNGAGGALLGNPQDIFVSGNYAYIASTGSNALEIVDISNPLAPVHKGSIVNGAGGALLSIPTSVYVSGNYVYITSKMDHALEIIDVSNPAAPFHKGKISNGAGGAVLFMPKSVFVSGNYAYVATSTSPMDGAMEVVDVSNPAAPVHAGSIVHGDGGALMIGANSVFVSGQYAYVTSEASSALEIIGVSEYTGTGSSGASATTTINAAVQQQLSVALTDPFTGTWALSQGANSQNYGNLSITANVPWSESTSATNGDYLMSGSSTPLTNKLQLNAADVTAYTTSGVGSSSTALNFAQEVIIADPAGSYGTVVTFTVNAV